MPERTRYDEKLARILREAAVVFSQKGYHRASVRDIAAATGISLSGLYYYFESKEELLFLIQEHCFDTIVAKLEDDLASTGSAREGIEVVIRNHLGFFVGNMQEMKVLSHEADALSGEYRARISELKRRYTHRVESVLAEMVPDRAPAEVRLATLALFGMMNWIYNWYRPERDGSAEELAAGMTQLFMQGFLSPTLDGVESALPVAEAGPSIWRE